MRPDTELDVWPALYRDHYDPDTPRHDSEKLRDSCGACSVKWYIDEGHAL